MTKKILFLAIFISFFSFSDGEGKRKEQVDCEDKIFHGELWDKISQEGKINIYKKVQKNEKKAETREKLIALKEEIIEEKNRQRKAESIQNETKVLNNQHKISI